MVALFHFNELAFVFLLLSKVDSEQVAIRNVMLLPETRVSLTEMGAMSGTPSSCKSRGTSTNGST